MHPQIITKPELFAQFVETARKNGIEEICITDHMPLIGSSLKDRLPAGSVREYCETAKRLKEQYRDVLSVKIGIEIDYHPTVTDQIRRVLEDDGFREEDCKDVIDDVLNIIAAKGLHLEINTHLAVSQNDLSSVYPSPMILSMAAEKNIPFSFGSDAHKPEDVGALLPELRKSPVYGKAIRTWEAT
ncbi:MAG: PHP domain-containing protein [Lachnospiraceae bacterium]|nr:PHP domain-containing protein [Lachnospiraceae bacterium]